MKKVMFVLKYIVQGDSEPPVHIANATKTRCGKVLRSHAYSVLDSDIPETCVRCKQLASGHASSRISRLFTKYEPS